MAQTVGSVALIAFIWESIILAQKESLPRGAAG